jgi:hypothetical protein
LSKFLKEFKESGLQRTISAATELAIDLEVEPEFQSVKRIRYVKMPSLKTCIPLNWSKLLETRKREKSSLIKKFL